jgi:ATPase subunit of ABC transporter with duplicated ATPase domains
MTSSFAQQIIMFLSEVLINIYSHKQIKPTHYLYKTYITTIERMANNMTTTANTTESAATKKMKFEEEKKIDEDVVVAKPIVNIKNMNFSYDGVTKNIIGLNCCIEPNSKIILVGANGAGKSTLLRILTGQIFMGIQSDEFDINGRKTANDQANGIAYLGGTWKRRRTGFEGMCPYQMDCAASEMMEKWQNQHLERRDELVKVLGINLKWRMHEW